VALGTVFLVLGLVSSWGFVTALTGLGDPEPAFEGSRGWIEATRAFGVVLFGVFAVVAAAVGWFLAGGALRRTARRLLGRG
jgi:hypothetical protein